MKTKSKSTVVYNSLITLKDFSEWEQKLKKGQVLDNYLLTYLQIHKLKLEKELIDDLNKAEQLGWDKAMKTVLEESAKFFATTKTKKKGKE